MEFADYRPFTPGDDIRSIDWSAYARSRHLLLKLFEEQQELPVHILLDNSSSMDWGSPAKFDQARRIAAGLAYLATRNLDQLSVVPLGGTTDAWLPGRGRVNFFRLLDRLAKCPISPTATPLSTGIQKWLVGRPSKGLVIWITDGWGQSENDLFEALDRLRHARHEMVLIELRHPAETHADTQGEFDLVDSESGAVRPVVIDRETSAAFDLAAAHYLSRIAAYCHQHTIARVDADASQPVTVLLRQFLEAGGFVGP